MTQITEAEREAVHALWRVVYNDKGHFTQEMRLQAIRSLGAYLHVKEATSHLNSVIYDERRYDEKLKMAAIQVLGKA